MSPVWELCYGGYVITPAYLIFDSLRLLGVRISCLPSPHVQSVSHPWLNGFLSSCELEKMDVSTSPLFPGNSIFLPHTHGLSLPLSLAFSHHFFQALSFLTKPLLPTLIPFLFSCSLAVTLTPPSSLPPSLPPSLLLSSQLHWALGDVSGISLALHSLPSGSSYSFLFFSCHWLFGRKMHFGRVYSFLLITLLCTALGYCDMPRLVTKTICLPTDPVQLRHAGFRVDSFKCLRKHTMTNDTLMTKKLSRFYYVTSKTVLSSFQLWLILFWEAS